jgi:hypothetical protein
MCRTCFIGLRAISDLGLPLMKLERLAFDLPPSRMVSSVELSELALRDDPMVIAGIRCNEGRRA